MAWGTMAVDWETRINYERLRQYRLKRAMDQQEKHGIGAFLCFDFYNIRYITSAHIGEWARDKLNRYVLLPQGRDPILFEMGTAALAHKLHSPWLADHVRYALPTWTRADSLKGAEIAGNLARNIKGLLQEFGLAGEPLGVDVADVILLQALQREGLDVVDARSPMLDARLIKNQDEIQLLKVAASMADAAYDTIVNALKPGIRENELVGLANETLYRLGSEDVECVNVVSGPRGNPHPHVFSDRIIRPGDLVYFDLMHAYNGYRTCYYRTFICGRPSPDQLAAYRQTYDWLYEAISVVKPGITSADIASRYPSYQAWGLNSELEARGLATGHGIGLSIHEKPGINRIESLSDPFPIQEGMVFALETYAQTPDGRQGCRIEEEVLVTADGHEILTRYPCEELISCGVPRYW
ncbi:MAG: M24 family metallopeptidase [Acidobacteriaceae bacterium]